MRYSLIFLGACITASLPIFAIADQDGTCFQKGGKHKAHYHCPEDYEVVIAGDGTYVCDGECYREGDKESLKKAISRILQRRGVTVSNAEIMEIGEVVFVRGHYRVKKGPVSFVIRVR